MEFDNCVLERMDQNNIKYNAKYSSWYTLMSEEMKLDNLWSYSETLLNKSERIYNCLNYWEWDVYHSNKLMDLQLVNRCKNNRFCPNCRKFNLACAMHNLSKPLNKLLLEGYYPYLVTLTVPNVPGEELRETIDKMTAAFKKLFSALYYPLDKNNKGFKGRYMSVDAALRVLEITYNFSSDTYHPHFHCIFFSLDYDESIFIKDTIGEWSNNRQSYNFYSTMDIQIMKLWTMCYNNQSLRIKTYNNINLEELYLCDIKEMDSSGILEVLKYTFKDVDIKDYTVFKTIEAALDHKRIRQGYGLLYNAKVEDDSDGEKIPLAEFITEFEEAKKLYTREIRRLTHEFKDYRKISRAKAHDKLNM